MSRASKRAGRGTGGSVVCAGGRCRLVCPYLRDVDHHALGFDPSNLLIVRADATPDSVTPENKVAYAQRIAEAVAAVPGVARASLSRITPMSDGNTTTGVQLSGAPPLLPGERTVWINFIEQRWFETYGMRVIAGRDFAVSDTGAEAVAVVNQAFVRRFASGQNVIGQHVTSVTPGRLNALIVGVVNDSVYRTVRLGVVPTMFCRVSGQSWRVFGVSLLGDREADVAACPGRAHHCRRDRQSGSRPRIHVSRLQRSELHATVIQERLVALMSGFFAALAMLLAALGVYGVTVNAVGRRRAEIAVRMALGASPGDVVRLVLGRVAVLILGGAAVGVGVSLWAARFVGPLLFGVEPRYLITLVAAAAGLGLGRIVCGMAPGSPGVTASILRPH